ncbi:hypothetical protein GQR58_004412 [Nymphon striatum]|nr:hypothetical protein GQR58_004412 [Nymphon striatum]
MFRLMGMVRPDVETMQELAKRLSFSNIEASRMVNWAQSSVPKVDTTPEQLAKILYLGNKQGLLDAIKLETVHLLGREDDESAQKMLGHIAFAQDWQRPKFSVQGKDLIALGIDAGPEMGRKLQMLEEAWIESDFKLDKSALLNMKPAPLDSSTSLTSVSVESRTVFPDSILTIVALLVPVSAASSRTVIPSPALAIRMCRESIFSADFSDCDMANLSVSVDNSA